MHDFEVFLGDFMYMYAMLYTKMFHGYDKMKHTKYAKNNEIHENLFLRNMRKITKYAKTYSCEIYENLCLRNMRKVTKNTKTYSCVQIAYIDGRS